MLEEIVKIIDEIAEKTGCSFKEIVDTATKMGLFKVINTPCSLVLWYNTNN